jgi:VWFA-related protein
VIPLLTLLAISSAQPIPVFPAGVESVYVDVFVTQEGAPVTGLVAEDFEVQDNGVRQRVELVSHESIPLEILLAFDISGSLTPEDLERLRAASRVALLGLRPADRVGLLTFNEEVRLEVPPTADLRDLEQALARVKPGGMTALRDAIYAALVLRSGPGRGLAIVCSDGDDNLSWLSERDLLRVAEQSNVMLHVVAVDRRQAGRAGDRSASSESEAHGIKMLRRLAEATGGGVWLTASLEGLEGAFRQIVLSMDTRYVLRFDPPAARAGRHELKVHLRGRRGELRARPSYFVAR